MRWRKSSINRIQRGQLKRDRWSTRHWYIYTLQRRLLYSRSSVASCSTLSPVVRPCSFSPIRPSQHCCVSQAIALIAYLCSRWALFFFPVISLTVYSPPLELTVHKASYVFTNGLDCPLPVAPLGIVCRIPACILERAAKNHATVCMCRPNLDL